MSDLKSWEELTPLEQAQATWWDMYKDVHGVRPRGVDTSNWTLEGFIAQIEALSIQLKEVMEEERAAEKEAICRFEERVSKLLEIGASRDRAIGWLMDAEDLAGDNEHFEYTNGLPFGYLSRSLSNG